MASLSPGDLHLNASADVRICYAVYMTKQMENRATDAIINRAKKETIGSHGLAIDEREALECCEEDLRHAEVQDMQKLVHLLLSAGGLNLP